MLCVTCYVSISVFKLLLYVRVASYFIADESPYLSVEFSDSVAWTARVRVHEVSVCMMRRALTRSYAHFKLLLVKLSKRVPFQ